MSNFEQILTEGKPNGLGRTDEVIDTVLKSREKLDELFECLFSDNEYVRMRAGDALEKVCREQPAWLEPYVDRLLGEVSKIDQPSVQWHLTEILAKVELEPSQQKPAINWLKQRLGEEKPDWIVARRCMETLIKFVELGYVSDKEAAKLIEKQTSHPSKSTVRVANNLLDALNGKTAGKK